MADLTAIERAWKAATPMPGREDWWTPSNQVIATAHKVTEGYVRKVAKKFGWVRNSTVTPDPLPPPPRTLLRRPAPDTDGMTDAELADNLLRRMLDELDTVTSHIGELEELIELETGGDRDDRRRAAMMKAVSLPVRSNTLKMLLAARADSAPGAKKGKKELQQEAADSIAASGKFKPRVVA